MAVLSAFAVTFGRITTLLQVILYLPLTLDVAGQDAFLALSASLAVYYAFLSTVRTLTRRTSLAWLGDFLAAFQFVVVPACLLIVFHAYSPPSESYFDRKYTSKSPFGATSSHSNSSSSSGSGSDGMRARLFSSPKSSSGAPGTAQPATPMGFAAATSAAAAELGLGEAYLGPTLNGILLRIVALTFFLARRVPPWWHTFLRLSSPAFSLLEGIATLLVIQVVGSFSRWMIARSLSRRPPAPTRSYFAWVQTLVSTLTSAEFLQLFFLLASAFIYVVSALALYVSFEGATRNRPGAAAATGAAVSSAVWLTAIAFAVRKGNVVETALVFAYVVWNVYQLSDSLSFTADPLALIRSFKVLDTSSSTTLVNFPVLLDNLPPIVFVLVDLASNTVRQSARFGAAAAAALPKSVILSLVYRLMVLYSASRILPLLKRQTDKRWDGDGSTWSSSASGSEESSEDSDDESVSSSDEDGDEDKKKQRRRGTEEKSSFAQENGNGTSKGKGKASASSARREAERRQRQSRRYGDDKGPRLREEEPFGACALP